MGGSATLDPNVLVDSLVDEVIDGLREDLHPAFGVRAYRTFTVRRDWSGAIAGQGQATETVVELRPQPRVLIWDGLRYSMEPCGLDEAGEIRLTEVSFTYTQAELDGGGDLPSTSEWLIRIDEAHGQEQRSRYYQHTRPPFADREKDMGFVLFLRAVSEAF